MDRTVPGRGSQPEFARSLQSFQEEKGQLSRTDPANGGADPGGTRSRKASKVPICLAECPSDLLRAPGTGYFSLALLPHDPSLAEGSRQDPGTQIAESAQSDVPGAALRGSERCAGTGFQRTVLL